MNNQKKKKKKKKKNLQKRRYKKVSSYPQRATLWLPLTNKSTQLEDYC